MGNAPGADAKYPLRGSAPDSQTNAGRQGTTTSKARRRQEVSAAPEPHGPRHHTPPIYTGWVVKVAPADFRFSIFESRFSIFGKM